MGRALLWFRFMCKRQCKRPLLVGAFFLLPVLILAMGQLEQGEDNGIRVGIYIEAEELSEEIYRNLLQTEGTFSFYRCETAEELLQDVASKKAECGYWLRENLKEKLDRGDYKKCIGLYYSPSTVTASMSTEVVFASLIEVYGQDLLKSFVDSSEIFETFDREEVFTEIAGNYQKYRENGSTFSFSYETTNGKVREGGTSSKAVFPIRGFLAVYLLVIGLFSAVMLFQDEENGVFVSLPYRLKIWCRLIVLGTPVVLVTGIGGITLLLTGDWTGSGKDIAVLLLYAIAVILFSFFLKQWVKKPLILCSLIPVFAMAGLIACPVFLDITLVFQEIRILSRLLLPYYYLEANTTVGIAAYVPLTIIILVLGVLITLKEHFPKRPSIDKK